MTREEAIKWFKENPFMHKDHKPFQMAIEALEKENDIIDRITAQINTPNRGTCDYFIVDKIEEIIREYRG